MPNWKPEVFVHNEWSSNQLVFETEQEAARWAHDLSLRWIHVQASRATESHLPVNCRYENDVPVILKDKK